MPRGAFSHAAHCRHLEVCSTLLCMFCKAGMPMQQLLCWELIQCTRCKPLHTGLLQTSETSCCLLAQMCLTLLQPHGLSLPGSFVQGICQQEYWRRVPFPSPGDLPHPGMDLASSAWQGDSLPLSHLGSPRKPD